MRKETEVAAMFVLVASSLGIALAIVKREFFAEPRSSPRSTVTAVAVTGWESGMEAGRLIAGSPASPHIMIVFVDLECPVCASFSRIVDSLELRFQDSLAVYYVHAPARYHRFALPAARGAECAADLGAFKDWTKAVYAGQDSLGLRSWESYARAAGIEDTTRISECAKSAAAVGKIEQGIALSERMRIRRLPSVVVDGILFDGAPSIASVDSVVRRHGSSRR